MKKEFKVGNVFNFHITHTCNYKCVHCFCNFKDKPLLPFKDACKIVDNINRFFQENDIHNGRINLAGGEPLVYPYLDELIDYIHNIGLDVSIITNGSLLTVERIESWEGKVSCIGISIDSTREKIRNRIGRASDKPLKNQQIIMLCDAIHKAKIKLKVNFVISKMNLEEDMVKFLRILKPDRIKFFKLQLVEGINDEAKIYSISNEEFSLFKERHSKLKGKAVFEGEEDMKNSYLMIDANGEFLLNNNGKYDFYGNCLTEELTSIVANAPIDMERFFKRYKNENQPYHAERKICVIGGHSAWLKALKGWFSNVFYIQKDKILPKEMLSNVDVFWIKYDAVSHQLYNKIMDIARTYKIPCKYFNLDGVQSCARQIIEYEEELKSKKN